MQRLCCPNDRAPNPRAPNRYWTKREITERIATSLDISHTALQYPLSAGEVSFKAQANEGPLQGTG